MGGKSTNHQHRLNNHQGWLASGDHLGINTPKRECLYIHITQTSTLRWNSVKKKSSL